MDQRDVVDRTHPLLIELLCEASYALVQNDIANGSTCIHQTGIREPDGKMKNVRSELKATKIDVHDVKKVLIAAAEYSRICRMDPITQATLKQAQGLAQYLKRQLIYADNVLDDTYEKYKNEKNTRMRTPGMEMLCRTILSCDETIEKLHEELNAVRSEDESMKGMQSLREQKHEDLTSLVDSLLVVGVDSKNTSGAQRESGKDHQSYEKIKLLRDYAASRPVYEVTPTKLSPHGESMVAPKLNVLLIQSRIDVGSQEDQPANTRDTAAAPEGGTSIFSKPTSGSLFGKGPSGSSSGSTTTAAFDQSGASTLASTAKSPSAEAFTGFGPPRYERSPAAEGSGFGSPQAITSPATEPFTVFSPPQFSFR